MSAVPYVGPAVIYVVHDKSLIMGVFGERHNADALLKMQGVGQVSAYLRAADSEALALLRRLLNAQRGEGFADPGAMDDAARLVELVDGEHHV